MTGEAVPVAFLPRFTSFVGPGTYTTAPFAAEAFSHADVRFFRGPLVGGAASDPFRAVFEESHDALLWTEVPLTEVTTAGATSGFAVPFAKRWVRVRVELASDLNGLVALTTWLVGSVVRRTT
jgi:hypothetical protein